MSNRLFNANSWINKAQFSADTQQEAVQDIHIPTPTSNQESFTPSNFLIPGWKGGSIISKHAISVKKAVDDLWNDCRHKFKNLGTATRSLKVSIYDEFLSFVNSKGEQCHKLDNYTTFWEHLNSEDSPYKELLSEFSDVYSHRVVTIYLYKLRFIVRLCVAMRIPVTSRILVSTSGFLNKIFPMGGSKALKCEALQSNQYSWYRPSEELAEKIQKVSQDLHIISVTEKMKICTFADHENTKTSLDFKDDQYSHSISHEAFGFFVNHLLINLPNWIEKDSSKQQKSIFSILEEKKDFPKVVNCKFIGSNLTSFSLSHWLAQEACINEEWDQLICPDFVGNEFCNGEFVRNCHELQFMAYLIQFSKTHNADPIDFICRVMKEKYNHNADSRGQLKMFSYGDISTERLYNRVVLNLSNTPKTNPHHFLRNKITEQQKFLSTEGYLYVLTNQRLFVPSQSDKIEQLLHGLKLEANFSFEELKGKGEIPDYLYVFSKRKDILSTNDIFNELNFKKGSSTSTKESCLTFRWNGELSLFSDFKGLVDELSTFFQERQSGSTAMFQRQLESGLSFEFHQDAIVEGKLLHAISKDPSRITHPNFFKNLTTSCIPLDKCFQVEPLDNSPGQVSHSSNLTTDLLGIKVQHEEKYPYVLIVNLSEIHNIQIELIKFDSYHARLNEYGQAYYQYFGLLPKIRGLNINLFREFFSTSIGSQIIQLSLNSGNKNLKSKLKSLLIPSFFAVPTTMPDHFRSALKFLDTDDSELLKAHPEALKADMQAAKDHMLSLAKKYPWFVMGKLSFFKYNLEVCIDQLGRKQQLDYYNPMLLKPLMSLVSKPIFIQRDDLNIVPILPTLNLPLEKTELAVDDTNHTYLAFHANGNEIVQIHANEQLLGFIKFIADQALGRPIIALLKGIKIPAEADFIKVISSFTALSSSFDEVYREVSNFIPQIIRDQISTSN